MPSLLDGLNSGNNSLPLFSNLDKPNLIDAAPSLLSTLKPAPAPVVEMRDFDDPAQVRKAVYNKVYSAVKAFEPLENAKYRLELQDVDWADPEERKLSDHKKSILSGQTLYRRLRGNVSLIDKVTNKPVEKRLMTIAQVPHYTNNGTFTLNGVDYVLGNQFRLRPGVYVHEKENGELESHINVLPGKGVSHRYHLEPETGVFKLNINQANIPLLPVLKAVGFSDKELEQAWGKELFHQNKPYDDPKVITKLYDKIVRKPVPNATFEDKQTAVANELTNMGVDPEVTKRTLGKPYTKMERSAMLDTTVKLLKLSRGEVESDDRDHLAYQSVMGPEDLIAEPLNRTPAVMRQMLWKATNNGSLKNVVPGFLTSTVQSAFYDTGLANPSEEVNSLDMFDAQTKISRMGKGAIGSIDAIPDSARAVHPSQLGFVDLLRTSESLKIGVDLRLAHKARKGSDGKLYAPFIDAKTGKEKYVSPQDIADSVIAFPGQLEKNTPYVKALVKGKTEIVPREEVEYSLPHMENAFSPLSNIIPLKSSMKGQRVSMGSRFMIQALPVKDSEAPLVQSRVPGSDMSFDQKFGPRAGAVFAGQIGGRVVKVEPEEITVRYDDGSTQKHELYNNLPYNRKSFIHNDPLVKPGDRVEPGQILAKSNYTDNAGTVALGKNLKIAYIPFRDNETGAANYEDGLVISESAAKKLTSEHAYQHVHEWDDTHKKGKKYFASIFPAKYTKDKLGTMDDDGIVVPGTVVKTGDPLVLIAKQRELTHKQLASSHKGAWSDQTEIWDHHNDGIVTDVYKSDKGVNVVVKSYAPMEEADKMSNLYGGKGVVRIVPDERMPHDENGDPFEILANPLGIISRGNPGQITAVVLGKVAKKTGKPYVIEDFDSKMDDYALYAAKEAEKHGVPVTETVIDPVTGKKIPNVLTGYGYYLKLHHQAESKGSARGLGSYTSEGVPARGSGESQQAKKIALMDVSALMAHGALDVMKDNKLIRGGQNLEYWAQFMGGNTPATPDVPFVYKKFVDSLKGAGVNVVRRGEKTHIMALTDRNIKEMAGDRELKNAETVDWKDGMKPIAGGLFDTGITGGHTGKNWSKITLHEPLPNPVMEEPIRKLLNLTQAQFEAVLGGKEKLGEYSGPKAIQAALASINIDAAIEKAREDIRSGRSTLRNDAVKRLGFLKTCKDENIHPKDWILSSVPVLPPIFRPVSVMQGNGGQLVSDANILYKDLFDANTVLKELQNSVSDTSEERLNLYNAFKAVTGLGDPVNPKSVEKKVQGILGQIFNISPKYNTVQQRLLGTPVNLVGRGAVIPDVNLGLDEAGIPENQAWTVYSPFIVRRLVRRGIGRAEAIQAVNDRTELAKKAMLEEMDASPVILTRAPILHKFGHMAFWPKLVKGDAVRMGPTVHKGYNLDHDGDTMNWHLPVSQKAREEAAAKMLPSKNLFAVMDFTTPMYKAGQEFQAGLYKLTQQGKSDKPARVFATVKDMRRAWARGELDPQDPVQIVDSKM